MRLRVTWQSRQFINAIDGLDAIDSMQVSFFSIVTFQLIQRSQWGTARHKFDCAESQC